MWLHGIPLTYAVHCTIWINGAIVFKYTAHRWKHPNLWGNGFPKFVHTFYHQSSLGDKVQIYHALYHPNLQGKDVTKVAHKIYHPMSQGDKAHTLSYVNLRAMRSCKHTAHGPMWICGGQGHANILHMVLCESMVGEVMQTYCTWDHANLQAMRSCKHAMHGTLPICRQRGHANMLCMGPCQFAGDKVMQTYHTLLYCHSTFQLLILYITVHALHPLISTLPISPYSILLFHAGTIHGSAKPPSTIKQTIS